MMSDEDRELVERITALEQRIERHKNGETPPTDEDAYLYGTASTSAAFSSSPYPPQDYARPQSHWVSTPGTPYGSPRGRGRGRRHIPFKNRTLVLNPNGPKTSNSSDMTLSSGGIENARSSGWISKRDRHMQLINTSVYEQKTQERVQAMAETRKQLERAREDDEKAKVQNHIATLQNGPLDNGASQPHTPQIFVNNIRFLVAAGGSKLVRAQDESTMSRPTPKRTAVGGVQFYRSKHGNLYRAGLVQAKRLDSQEPAGYIVPRQTNYVCSKRTGVRKINELCSKFTSTGSCSKGPACRYLHDPEKVAICKTFLQTGKCQAGAECDLSHDPTPERVPACLHFVRGNCTHSDCRYAHVHVIPGATVCRAFAIFGYCSKGSECTEKHVTECPDYTNKGVCHNKKCHLPHVDRAGQLRKAAAKQDAEEGAEGSSDISSDDDYGGDSGDLDSDEFKDDIIEAIDSHELSQQNDFIKF